MNTVGIVDIGKDVDSRMEEKEGNSKIVSEKISGRGEYVWVVLKENIDSWNTTLWEINTELVTRFNNLYSL